MGRATFDASTFLGAAVGAGTVGSIDTQQKPFRYTGDGEVAGIDLHRFGEGLDIGVAARSALRGHAHRATSAWTAPAPAPNGSRSTRRRPHAPRATVQGHAVGRRGLDRDRQAARSARRTTARLTRVDPSVPFADPRFAASLTGTGRFTTTVRDLLTRTTTLADYDVEGTLAARSSEIHGLTIDRGRVEATLRDSMLRIAQAGGSPVRRSKDAGPARSRWSTAPRLISSTTSRASISQSCAACTGRTWTARSRRRAASRGPWSAAHASGNGTLTQPKGFDVSALTLSADYEATIPSSDASQTTARLNGRSEFVTVAGQQFQERHRHDHLRREAPRLRRARRAAAGTQRPARGPRGAASRSTGGLAARSDGHAWPRAVASGGGRPALARAGVVGRQRDHDHADRVRRSEQRPADRHLGAWRRDGKGALHVTADAVFLDTLQTAFERPTRYGGALDSTRRSTARATTRRRRAASR